jgi:hypothetical protein
MLIGGGHCNRLQSKVTFNRDFVEAAALPATVNGLTKAVSVIQPPRLIAINGGG